MSAPHPSHPIKPLFLLDPTLHFLNHGSFGAVPRPVFDAWQAWQRRLELQPVKFLTRDLEPLLHDARQTLGTYLGANADDLLFIPNATFGVNLLARSLPLAPGDEVLASDHEYGACDNAWAFACAERGAHYIRQPVALPVSNAEEIVEALWRGVTARTRVIFLSHITSPTALVMPVEAICRRARAAGILTVIDAAHVPGQLPLDLAALGADFVVGNLHKWLMAPKGAAFLFARRECQEMLAPLVVSWGAAFTHSGSAFIDRLQWMGTYDPSAVLAVPAAIAFQQEHQWDAVRANCRSLLAEALAAISALTGLPPPCPPEAGLFAQMGIAALPADADLARWKERLYDEFRVEVPLIAWQGQQFVRVSIQGYNGPEDVAALLAGLAALLRG